MLKYSLTIKEIKMNIRTIRKFTDSATGKVKYFEFSLVKENGNVICSGIKNTKKECTETMDKFEPLSIVVCMMSGNTLFAGSFSECRKYRNKDETMTISYQ